MKKNIMSNHIKPHINPKKKDGRSRSNISYKRLYELSQQALAEEERAHKITHARLHRLRKYINDLPTWRKMIAGINPVHPDLTD